MRKIITVVSIVMMSWSALGSNSAIASEFVGVEKSKEDYLAEIGAVQMSTEEMTLVRGEGWVKVVWKIGKKVFSALVTQAALNKFCSKLNVPYVCSVVK